MHNQEKKVMRNPEMITKGNKMLLFFLQILSNDFLGLNGDQFGEFFFFLTRRKESGIKT